MLRLTDIRKEYPAGDGKVEALRGVSIEFRESELVSILGPSGCGKTTLGRTILKLYEPDGGKIFFEGQELTHLKKKKMRRFRTDMQLVFQDPYSSLPPRMTVGSLIEEGVKVHKVVPKEQVHDYVMDIMKKCGLQPQYYDRYPHEFSGGQRQRIGIARSLIMEPEFIIADEPISALDVSIRAQVLNLMSKLQKERGLTYLFIAHDLSVMRFICDRIAVIHKGVIVELSETEKLFAHPLHPYTRALLSAIPMPDPESEREKVLEVYDPSCHHYETDKPVWTEIEPGHFIMANQEELAEYRKQLENN